MKRQRLIPLAAGGVVAVYLLANMASTFGFADLALAARWLALAVAVVVLYPTRLFHRRDTTFKSGVLFIALAFGSVFWSVNRQTTMLKAVALGLLLVAVYLFANSKSSRPIHARFLRLLAAVNILLVLSATAVMTFSPGQAFDTGRLQGPFGNPNGFGVALALTAPGLWAASPSTRRGRRTRDLLGLVVTALIVMSGSRSAFMILAVEGGIFVATVNRRRLWIGAYGVAVVATLLLLGGQLRAASDWFVEDLVYKGTGGVFDTRVDAFADTYAAALEQPFLGHGFGAQVESDTSRAGRIYSTAGVDREVGNSYLGLVEQIGMVGLAMALWLLGNLGRDLVKCRHLVPTAVWAAVTSVFIGGLAGAVFEAYLFSPGALEALLVWGAGAVLHRVAVAPRQVVVSR